MQLFSSSLASFSPPLLWLSQQRAAGTHEKTDAAATKIRSELRRLKSLFIRMVRKTLESGSDPPERPRSTREAAAPGSLVFAPWIGKIWLNATAPVGVILFSSCGRYE